MCSSGQNRWSPIRVILGTIKDTPSETIQFMLDLPLMVTRWKVEQVKAYFSTVENPSSTLQEPVKNTNYQKDAD